jgi:hypothetical protein
MYNITVDNNKKIFRVETYESFSKEEGEKCLKEFKQKISIISPKEYNLVMVGNNTKTSQQQELHDLQECLNRYAKCGFKNIYGILPKSPTAAMQLKRVVKDSNINVKLINSESEI